MEIKDRKIIRRKKKKKEQEYYTVCSWIEKKYTDPLEVEILDDLKLRPKHIKYFDLDGPFNKNFENIEPSTMGTVVDLCCRYLLTSRRFEAAHNIFRGFTVMDFDVHCRGNDFWTDPEMREEHEIKYQREDYKKCLNNDEEKIIEFNRELEINGLTDRAITLMVQLIRYNNFQRGGYKAFELTYQTPDERTIMHIRKMAERSRDFLKTFNDIRCGLYFNSIAFMTNKYVKCGDGDYWNNDIFFDMKVSAGIELYADDIKQQIVYYILSRKDRYKFKKCIIFNPRWGNYYEFNVEDIPKDLLKFIESSI